MKRFLTVILLLTFACKIHAQNDFVITLEGDTLRGKVLLTQNTFYDEVIVNIEEGEKQTLKVFQVNEINHDGETYDPIVYGEKRVVGKRVVKGRLSHYYVREQNESLFSTGLLIRKDKNMVISTISFRKRILELVDDCDYLVEKIKNKELGYSDLPIIIDLYNSDCKKAKGSDEDLSKLADLAQLILQITEKISNKEEIPKSMIDALKGYTQSSIDEKINQLLVMLENN